MRQALTLLAALQAQLPEAKHFRLALGTEGHHAGMLVVEFVWGQRVERCGLDDADYERPQADLIAEIVAYHLAHRNDPLPLPKANAGSCGMPGKIPACCCVSPEPLGGPIPLCCGCGRFIPTEQMMARLGVPKDVTRCDLCGETLLSGSHGPGVCHGTPVPCPAMYEPGLVQAAPVAPGPAADAGPDPAD
jgi:hypothetical protein